jgi:hypothetical protein
VGATSCAPGERLFPYQGSGGFMFGIIATVIVGILVVLMIVGLVRLIFKPNDTSVMEHLRGNDEKYE